MGEDEDNKRDVVDDDLYEEIDDDELLTLVEEERQKALERARHKRKSDQTKSKRPFPRWAFWVIAVAMLFQVVTFIPNTISIPAIDFIRSEEHTSELQSRFDLVCRLLLEKT